MKKKNDGLTIIGEFSIDVPVDMNELELLMEGRAFTWRFPTNENENVNITVHLHQAEESDDE